MWPCILKSVGHTRIRKTIKFNKKNWVYTYVLLVHRQMKWTSFIFCDLALREKLTSIKHSDIHSCKIISSGKRFRCEKIFFFRGNRTVISFAYLSNSPWSKLSCQKSVSEYTSAIYLKLPEAVPYKEIKKKVTADLKNEKWI